MQLLKRWGSRSLFYLSVHSIRSGCSLINSLSPSWNFFLLVLATLLAISGSGGSLKIEARHMKSSRVAYMAVTPGKNWLYICDHEAISDLLLLRNEFKRPLEILGWSFTPIALPIAWVLLLLTEPQISSMYLVQMYLLYGLQWFIHSSFFGWIDPGGRPGVAQASTSHRSAIQWEQQ